MAKFDIAYYVNLSDVGKVNGINDLAKTPDSSPRFAGLGNHYQMVTIRIQESRTGLAMRVFGTRKGGHFATKSQFANILAKDFRRRSRVHNGQKFSLHSVLQLL